MSIKFLTFGFCATLFFASQAGCANSSSRSLMAHGEAITANTVEQQNSHKGQVKLQTNGAQPISKEEAVAIAKEDIAKTYQSLNAFNAVACEKRTMWLVIFDGGGVEYHVDKQSGKILGVQNLPQLLNNDAANVGNKISETEAIKIAENHFGEILTSYGDSMEHIKEYDAVACELSNAWRVFFEYRMKPGETLATMPNPNPPNYLINKWTGEITYTTHQIIR